MKKGEDTKRRKERNRRRTNPNAKETPTFILVGNGSGDEQEAWRFSALRTGRPKSWHLQSRTLDGYARRGGNAVKGQDEDLS
jgi:hypothetical protein